MKQKNETKIEFRQYNNTSRKGIYIAIKIAGGHTRLYKYKGQSLDPYIEYQKDISTGTKTGTIGQYLKTYEQAAQGRAPKGPKAVQATKYVKSIQKKPILKQFKKGTYYGKLPNAIGAQDTQIRATNKQWLKYIVWHKKLREIINTEENLTKVAYLHEHQIEAINEHGNTFITAHTTNKTLKQVVDEINKKLFKGEEEKPTSNYPITQKMKTMYPEVKKTGGGTLTTIKITTIFRRA